MAARRGQISIDKIVAVRSSVLPLYVILKKNGTVTAQDEVSEDGNDFLTTTMYGDQISFQSLSGDYLSVEGDQVCTRRFCSVNERFTVQKLDTRYCFQARGGKFLSISDRPPFLALAPTAGDTETFQLFSLMMCGVNVGKQLESLERTGWVMLDNLLEDSEISSLRSSIVECGGGPSANPPASHEIRAKGLAVHSQGFAKLATHPIVMQLVRRMTSPKVQLSSMESCRTDANFVRKELEQTTWEVVHPYSEAEFPGVMDARISFTVTWFLDELNSSNSTWAWVKPQLLDGNYLPRLPQLSSPEESAALVQDARPLLASQGSAWLYLGPVWMSNNAGAASFWKDYDAQTRYKHLSGQKDSQSFRALTDSQRTSQPDFGLCPTLVQATYIREYVTPKESLPSLEELAELGSPPKEICSQKTLC